jgi:hypothetical protein
MLPQQIKKMAPKWVVNAPKYIGKNGTKVDEKMKKKMMKNTSN